MEFLSLSGINLDPETITKRFRIVDQGMVYKLVDAAQAAIAPRAAFKISYVDQKNETGVVIDGVSFSSRVLCKNLNDVGRVFPFVLTLGKALDEIIELTGDILEKYLLDEIGNIALNEARSLFEYHLRSSFVLERVSCMAPGSLENWPIEEQKLLFGLLPGLDSAIGVSLTEHYLMIPKKSISGIYFPSEVTFLSCQLCPREHCNSRKARYDIKKASKFGIS